MDIPLLNKFKGNLDFSKIDFTNISKASKQYCRRILVLLRSADRHALVQSLAIVIGFYAIIFGLVYLRSSATLTSLEDSMPSETVEVSKGVAFGQEKSPHITDKEANLVTGLSQREDIGNIPVIRRSDQLTSFRAYQSPFEFNNLKNKDLLAFMVTDFGLSEETSNIALDILPPQVSFLLSPYSELPMEWIKRARAKGHEVWIDLPIQNKKSIDQGLNTIFHHQSLSKKVKAMHKTLARALGYVGVGIFLDKSSLPVDNQYKQLSDELYSRGLGIFEKNPNAPPYIEAIATAKGAPFVKADLEVLQMQGKNSFQEIEGIVQERGYAVAVIPSYPKAIKNLAVWIEKAGKVDYAIAPISAIYDLPLERSPSSHGKGATSGLKPSDHVAQPVSSPQNTSHH